MQKKEVCRMERLTDTSIGGFASVKGATPVKFPDYETFWLYAQAINTLAAYEKTGLTPEEIMQYKPSCKIGDVVYYITGDEVAGGAIQRMHIYFDTGVTSFHTIEIGKNIFLDLEEAEKALGRMK